MRRSRILAVDDDDSIRALLSAILGMDHEVLTAANGMEALELLHGAGERVDLILLDIMMPSMDGFEVLTAIRQHPDTADIPVVVLTARSDRHTAEHARDLGAEGWLTKPYNTDTLERMVLLMLEQNVVTAD